MKSWYKLFFVSAFFGALTGCAIHVPVEKVYGTYIASYPYGTDTMTFNPDHTFLQTVIIGHVKPAIAKGHWEFDPQESRVSYRQAMIVDDGFGGLRPDWYLPSDGWISLPVEKIWFRTVINSGSPYPYAKQ